MQTWACTIASVRLPRMVCRLLLILLCEWSSTAHARTPLGLSLAELSEVMVTSVSKRSERLDEAAAAVYVITHDEIERSGVTSIPEALRLAPGVEVARNGSTSWTISMRGFSNDLSNKLLVLIDGRSVYSPLFAGVFWDAQDLLLQDVDRIEVIGGPGGTVWGANAVNGVINIITRPAWDTMGGLVEAGIGDETEFNGALRYGGRLGERGAGRAYFKRRDYDASKSALSGRDAYDDWHMEQAGFRTDWAAGDRDSFTLQGDVYHGNQQALVRSEFTLGTLPVENVRDEISISGYNVLANWQRPLENGSDLRLQLYWDHTDRDIPGTFSESRDTVDIDWVHKLPLLGPHDLTWGAGIRVTTDDVEGTQFATFLPKRRTDPTYSLFAQDRIDLWDSRVFLTLGTKLEHNNYTGLEYQPSARLTWLATDKQTLWAAASRAVRVPARLNEDLSLFAPVPFTPPLYVNVEGNDDFDSEKLFSIEAGWRVAFTEALSGDLALYHNDYRRLLSQELRGGISLVPGPRPYLLLPAVQLNRNEGEVYGGTAELRWQPVRMWRLDFQVSAIEFDLDRSPGGTDVNGLTVEGNSPDVQAALYSWLSLPYGVSVYTGVRWVNDLPTQNVPSYWAVDLNLQWQITAGLEASARIENVNDASHLEFGEGREIERGYLLGLEWTF